MKGADDMIGLVLGAVLGSGLYGAEKSMQIDSRTRKRYAKAFAMEQEAHRLVEVKMISRHHLHLLKHRKTLQVMSL